MAITRGPHRRRLCVRGMVVARDCDASCAHVAVLCALVCVCGWWCVSDCGFDVLVQSALAMVVLSLLPHTHRLHSIRALSPATLPSLVVVVCSRLGHPDHASPFGADLWKATKHRLAEVSTWRKPQPPLSVAT